MYKTENNEGRYFQTLRMEFILVKMIAKRVGGVRKIVKRGVKKY